MLHCFKYGSFFLGLLLVLGCTEKAINHQKEKKSIEKNTRKYKADLSDPNNKLSGKIETLELRYILWGCNCANCIEINKYKKLDEKDTLSKHVIFIEPAEEKLKFDPAKFDIAKNSIILKGQFYVNPDYPKGTPEEEEPLRKARVFRYTEMKIATHNF